MPSSGSTDAGSSVRTSGRSRMTGAPRHRAMARTPPQRRWCCSAPARNLARRTPATRRPGERPPPRRAAPATAPGINLHFDLCRKASIKRASRSAAGTPSVGARTPSTPASGFAVARRWTAHRVQPQDGRAATAPRAPRARRREWLHRTGDNSCKTPSFAASSARPRCRRDRTVPSAHPMAPPRRHNSFPEDRTARRPRGTSAAD